jgi:uncharacterized SAM-binding protein YcdF (DUF218 family)
VEILRQTIKALVPGSALFLAAGCAVGVLLLFRGPRAGRVARWGLTGLLVFYLLLSLQGTSDLLASPLTRGYSTLRSAADAHGARVVVVLGNGIRTHQANGQEVAVVNLESAFNALEAARVYRLLGDPLVLVSGGKNEGSETPESEVLALALERLGVPGERIVLESVSQNTYAQGANVSAWLAARGETKFVLVTAPEHMRRAVGVFATHGAHPTPSMSVIQYGGRPPWLPTGYALEGSRNAMYEYLALGFYRLRGWV